MTGKISKTIAVTLLILSCSMNAVYAGEYLPNGQIQMLEEAEEESYLLPGTVQHSRDIVTNEPRGSIISTAISDISNAGGGDIDILIQTMAHIPCEQIHHKAFLERWEEADQDWSSVDSFEFIEYQSDHPDEPLTYLTSYVTVKNQPTGYYYRVRGFHSVTAGDIMQGYNTRTDGVLITAKP